MTALKLSPRDSLRGLWYWNISEAYFVLGMLDQVLAWSSKAIQTTTITVHVGTIRIAALALLGNAAQANAERAALMSQTPDLTVSKLLSRNVTLPSSMRMITNEACRRPASLRNAAGQRGYRPVWGCLRHAVPIRKRRWSLSSRGRVSALGKPCCRLARSFASAVSIRSTQCRLAPRLYGPQMRAILFPQGGMLGCFVTL